MRRFFVRFNGSESFVHTRSSAGFTIITSGFKFSVHTGESPAGPPLQPLWKVVRRLERELRLWRGIVCAPDRLVVVHHGSGHQTGLIRRQKCNGARNFMRVNETAKWLCGRRLFQPIWACTVMLNLNPVFAL